MQIGETLLGIIDELYAGALDPARLTSSLDHVAALAGASGGLMYLMDENERRIRHGALSNFDLDSHGNFDGVLAEQGHYYRRMPLGSPIHMHTVWPLDAMRNTAFFQEVLEKQDVLYGAGTLLVRQSGLHGMIVLNRSERAGPFSRRNLNILRILAPHLGRVLRIAMEMNAIASERAMFVSALDNLSIGVIFADWRGKPLHLNRAAERMIAANDGFGVKSGRLTVAEDNEARLLAELIAGATGHGEHRRYRCGGSCRITRTSTERMPWQLLVAPCSEVTGALAPVASACMILVHDPSVRSSTTADHLRQLFGLTGQELKISMLAAEGHGIAHVADRMGLSALTVRNHLQRVFEKTGTGRQAELARLVAAVDATVPNRAD